MNALRKTLAPALLGLVLVTTGCLSPYLKRAADVPAQKPTEVLVAGFVARFESGGEKSLLDMAVDAAQNSGLESFGQKATPLLAEVLAEHGYTVTFDQARSAKLDAMQLASNSGTAALTGQWRHPEASYWVPQTIDSLFVKPADVLSKIKGETTPEYFAFTDITIRDGGMLFKEPHVVVRTVVYDQDARKVLDLQGIGEGGMSMFIVDRSPANLEKALKQGFASLKGVKEEAL